MDIKSNQKGIIHPCNIGITGLHTFRNWDYRITLVLNLGLWDYRKPPMGALMIRWYGKTNLPIEFDKIPSYFREIFTLLSISCPCTTWNISQILWSTWGPIFDLWPIFHFMCRNVTLHFGRRFNIKRGHWLLHSCPLTHAPWCHSRGCTILGGVSFSPRALGGFWGSRAWVHSARQTMFSTLNLTIL